MAALSKHFAELAANQEPYNKFDGHSISIKSGIDLDDDYVGNNQVDIKQWQQPSGQQRPLTKRKARESLDEKAEEPGGAHGPRWQPPTSLCPSGTANHKPP